MHRFWGGTYESAFFGVRVNPFAPSTGTLLSQLPIINMKAKSVGQIEHSWFRRLIFSFDHVIPSLPSNQLDMELQ